jgi:nucleoside-diphosphate-sugar epimerase
VTALELAEIRVLVLGGGGFLGRRCALALATAGARVVAFTRRPMASTPAVSSSNLAGRYTLISGDLSTAGAGRALLDEVRPHAVVNAVGYGVASDERDDRLARRLNADLVQELAEALVEAEPILPSWPGQRLVHLGSAFEYGSVDGAVTEATECRPRTVYGMTKLEGTRRLSAVAGEKRLRAVCARLATVYGSGEHPHRLLPSLLRAARTTETLSFTAGEQERDFTFVDDVAEGVVRLVSCKSLSDPVLNLATGRLTAVRAFAERAREMLGIPPDRLRFGDLPYRPDEVWQGAIDVGRLEAALRWRPATSIDDGIRRTIAETGHAGTDTT